MHFLSADENRHTAEVFNHVVELVAVAVAVMFAVADFRNFNFNPQSNHDDSDKHKDVKCFKCNQDGHIVKNCPYNNKQNTAKRESSNMAELEGVTLKSHVR